MALTSDAFGKLRMVIGEARPPRIPAANEGENIPLTTDQGLKLWEDGPATGEAHTSLDWSLIDFADRSLWVVRPEDVVSALETEPYALTLPSGILKHTNLTGGKEAYAGGEIVKIDAQTYVINGKSGRYGPRSAAEMAAVEQAFMNSGYIIWSAGYDEEANRPYSFDVDPIPVT